MNDIANRPSQCPLCGSQGTYLYTGRDFMFNGDKEFVYHQCTHCDATYPWPVPNEKKITSYYPDDYRIYKDLTKVKKYSGTKKTILRYKFNYRHIKQPVIMRILAPVLSLFFYRNSLRFTLPGRALDIGCGNGYLLQKLADVGWLAEGVEFNEHAVQNCRSQGFAVHHGDLHSAELDDESFNLITTSHVIEHVPDPDAFLKEASRILQPGGQLLVRTPNGKALGRKWFGRYWYADDVPRHLIIFNVGNLDKLASKHGFRRIYLGLYTSPKNLLNSIDYKFSNKGKPSKKRKLRRLIAKLYVFLAFISRRGDEIYAIYEKKY